MAHRVARPARYQGGASFNIFSAQGSNPTGDCKVCGKGVQKLYDKSVKTYVYSLCGGPASKIQLPKDENKTGLQLLQPFIVFQIFVPSAQPLTLELRVSDTTNTRRKMYFSTSFCDIKSTPLHCQIPITMITRGIWLSLSIHVADLFVHCFKGMVFKSVDTIVLGPVCKLRKIFTMRNRLSNVGSMCSSFDVSGEDFLPQEHMFAIGVENAIQVLDMMALQMSISDLSNPSNGTEEDILKLRKVKLNKSESRQVHVAFGSRMPLPLSTVQINTSLPGDNKSHSIKAFSKDRERTDWASRSIHPQSEIPSSMYEQNWVENKVENKSETLQNLLKHANNFNKNHIMMKLRKDQILSTGELPIMNESIERSSNVCFTTQELQLSSNFTTTDAFKQMQKPIEAGIEGIMVLTSSTKDGMMNMLSKGDPTITHLEWSNDEIHPTHVPQLRALNNEVPKNETLEASTNKVVSEEPTTFIKKKIEEYKLPDLGIGLGKYVRRASHLDSDRRKEYRQSRYLDSPPESPPCGWTSCIEDENEEKPLRLPSFFNKICENIDDLEKSKDSIDVESTINGNSNLMDSLDLKDEGKQCTKEAIQDFLNDENAKCDNSLQNLHIEQSKKDILKSTSKSINNFMEDRPRPTGVTHEKFDLGDGDNFMFQDSEFAEAMSDEDYSFGRHSWSSNDHSQQEQGGEQFLVIDTRSFENLHDKSQELNTFQDDDNEINDNDSPIHPLRFLNQYTNDHGSFEFDDTINDDQIEQLRSSLIITQPQSKIPHGDIEISTCNDGVPFEMSTSSSNESMESISKHSISSFTLKNEQENAKEVEISNCIIEYEDASITLNTGRPDEDLDLLYDPTLDCYYDPKTNRYYELK